MKLPKHFIYLKQIDASILQDIKYFTDDNFIGRPIKGYEAPKCILTEAAASALVALQKLLKPLALSLKVYDGYRPQMAVDDFIDWTRDPQDQKMKKSYYPRVNKADFFELQYLAMKSSHSRGSTVDLAIVHLHLDGSTTDMNMGTSFDFMDELSHPLTELVEADARKNRLFLREKMEQVGFLPCRTEWWHFTLKDEPFLDTYFNFTIK